MAERGVSAVATRQNWADRMGDALKAAAIAAISRTALEAVQVMKDSLKTPGANGRTALDTGELHDSITYALLPENLPQFFPASTLRPGNPNMGLVGAAGQKFVISPVTERFVAKVGTADPKAHYVEYGTGAHKTPNNQAEFVARVTAWCQRHGITDSAEIARVISAIRHRGTLAHPFLAPAKEVAREHLGTNFQVALKGVLARMPKVVRMVGKASKGAVSPTSLEGDTGLFVQGGRE